MTSRMRRRIENGVANSLVLAAVGLRIGFWIVDHIEFGIPGATIRNLWRAERARRAEQGGAA